MEIALHPALVEDGRFKVKRCLGMGGFGVVFAAHDTRTNTEVAIKWLRNSDAGTLARFKREFRSLADLVHPNLVTLRELITVAGEWFFTMDLVHGVELITWLRPASPVETALARTAPELPVDGLGSTIDVKPSLIPSSAPRSDQNERLEGSPRPLCLADLPRVRSTFEQLASGLDALHALGMIHRDVKPSNVLVTRDGHVQLLDFGLVTEVGEDGVARTITGNVVGTPAYMSPEQALGSPVTQASDWYAVGTILFEALTGRVPFDGEPQAIMVRKQLADPAPPSDFVRGVPRALSELCSDLLSRDPAKRPGSDEVRARLRQAVPLPGTGSVPPPAVGTSGAPSPNERAATFVGRETHMWALDEAADEAERGNTVIALVHGPSGMGKSSLVRRFLATTRAERPEAVILEGRCYERESMPYEALDSLVDALCRYLQRLPEVAWAKLLPRDLAALARVFPVFHQFESRGSRRTRPSADAVRERRKAFEALRELLARVADQSPLILFIDDLQWGGGDSEPLLVALLKPPDPPPMVLIACYRTEDATTAPLVRALRKLSGAGAGLEVCEIPVGELSPEAARDLAASLLDTGENDVRATVLAHESLGSPLFLRQLAALGGSTDGVDLSSALASRVAAQSPEAKRLLEMLAVSAKPLRLAVAARAADIEHDADGILAKLRAETLVRTRGIEARDEVEIYHERIRQIIVDGLSGEELKARHGKLARVLSSTGDADAEALATHFAVCGEPARAAEYAERAADRASGALAFARAAEMYEMAMDLGSTAGRDARGLGLKLAEALVGAGRGRDAADRFLAVAKSASAVDALELRRRAAEQLLFSGRIDEGLEVVRDILDAMRMRAPKSRLGTVVSLLWSRVLLRLRGIRFRERTTDELARGRLVAIDTYYSIGMGLGMVDPIMGADFQTRYLLLALKAGEPVRIAKGLALEAAYRAADGEKSRGAIARFLAQSRTLADAVKDPRARALATLMEGVAAAVLGDFPAAVTLCDRATVELRDTCTGVAWELDNAAFFAGYARVACGRLRELAEQTGPLIEDARNRGDLYGEVLLRLQCAWFVALAADDVDKAERELDVLTDTWSRERFLLQHAWQMLNRADTALYDGAPERAAKVLDDAWPELTRSMFLRTRTLRARVGNAVGRTALARAFAAEGGDERAALLDVTSREVRALYRTQWGLSKGYALLLEAGVAAARGQTPGAVSGYERAAQELDAKGARPYATAARARLGELRGGSEGAELVETAVGELRDEGIAAPHKMIRMMAPGVDRALGQ